MSGNVARACWRRWGRSSDWFIVRQAPNTPRFNYLIGSRALEVNISLMAKQ